MLSGGFGYAGASAVAEAEICWIGATTLRRRTFAATATVFRAAG